MKFPHSEDMILLQLENSSDSFFRSMIKTTKIALGCLVLSVILEFLDSDENTMLHPPLAMRKLAKFALRCTEKR